jgi:steroid 5-alpha reductase family enzyme
MQEYLVRFRKFIITGEDPRWTRLTGDWKRLHSEKLYSLYFLTNIISMIKSRRLGAAKHVAHMG